MRRKKGKYRISPSMTPLTMSWTCCESWAGLPVKRIQYFRRVAMLSSGPTVNVTGSLRLSFSCVIAWIMGDMSKGVLLLARSSGIDIHANCHDPLTRPCQRFFANLDVALDTRTRNRKPRVGLQSTPRLGGHTELM